MVALPIYGGSYPSRSKPFSAQRCINWYIQPAEGGGLSEAVLYGTPGISEIANTGMIEQVNRGSHVMEGIAYFVNGTSLYRLNRTTIQGVDSFSVDDIGTIAGTSRVSMADNGTQLMILVPGGSGYIWNESTTTFEEITAPGFTANGNPQYVVFLDGYFVVTTDTKRFIVSALNDGTNWDALDFGSAEADPDPIVAPVVNRNQLFICGSETIEAFQNIGGSAFPFQRVPGFVLPRGLRAAFSVINVAGTYAFIGAGVKESPSVYAFTGNDVQRISNDGIDEFLRTFSDSQIEDAFAVSYSQDGAEFACWIIGTETICYNFTSGKWTERSSRFTSGDEMFDSRWRVNSLVSAYGRIIVGDSQDGRIGEMSLDIFDEYGENILRTLITVPFSNEGKSIFVPRLELTMEAGVGDFETDPQIRVSRSRDGHIFKDERQRGIGKVGEYERRSIWRRFGRVGRFELFKFEYSEMFKPVIIKLEAEFAGGYK